ncbi:MAG: guanine deaminase [Marinospirillum sp.]|uniref:guanine deaminase n=1 Tax=Marinospirillum sp. TaxID=2183934 RepID=UPI0019ECE343|nr:guanine deaminase [Marinospirillum sp.]MBE0506244.1 guanine deaminase [Marinospirillum sp.]
MSSMTALRGEMLDFADGLRHWQDGLLLIGDGRITAIGDAEQLLPTLSLDQPVQQLQGLLLPGFIDTHIHYSQTGIIASHGEQLLDWLQRYTYPQEMAFSDPHYAAQETHFFLDELARNGTTTAMVYPTVHPASVKALFAAAQARSQCILTGKVMMDRFAPAELLDTPDSAYRDSKMLIERWHGQDRLKYVLTPRFAITSSPAQLEKVSQLYREYPEVYLQTHLSENHNELLQIRQLFPAAKNYLDVYDHYGLLGERSIFGHCLHLSNSEWQRLADTHSVIAFCPTSNLFLGSGLFDLQRCNKEGVRLSLATDVGGGTSFSLLTTLAEAYKVARLQGTDLNPQDGFYQITLGNARALELDNQIGSLEPGKYADLVLLDTAATPLLEKRCQLAKTIEEKLFALMFLGGQQAIAATWIAGKPV